MPTLQEDFTFSALNKQDWAWQQQGDDGGFDDE